MEQTVASTAHLNLAHLPNIPRQTAALVLTEDDFIEQQAADLDLQAHYAGTLGLTRSCDLRFNR